MKWVPLFCVHSSVCLTTELREIREYARLWFPSTERVTHPAEIFKLSNSRNNITADKLACAGMAFVAQSG